MPPADVINAYLTAVQSLHPQDLEKSFMAPQHPSPPVPSEARQAEKWESVRRLRVAEEDKRWRRRERLQAEIRMRDAEDDAIITDSIREEVATILKQYPGLYKETDEKVRGTIHRIAEEAATPEEAAVLRDVVLAAAVADEVLPPREVEEGLERLKNDLERVREVALRRSGASAVPVAKGITKILSS